MWQSSASRANCRPKREWSSTEYVAPLISALHFDTVSQWRRTLLGGHALTQKVTFCDDDHIALVQSALLFKTEEKGAPMRQALSIAAVATLLIVTVVEVIAAAGKTVVARNHFYAAPVSGISIAVPSGMKSFPTEVLPQ
jgi:hypothetical protein